MERWIKYNGKFVNLGNVTCLSVEKIRKEDIAYAVNMTETRISKDKKWRLSADYQLLDTFSKKPEAERAAEAIIKGTYDCK